MTRQCPWWIALWVGAACLCCRPSDPDRQTAPKVRRDGNTLRWERQLLPLRVWFDAELPPDHIDAYRAVSGELNRAAGQLLFRLGEAAPRPVAAQPPRGHVYVSVAAPGTNAVTKLRFDPDTGVLRSAAVILPEDAGRRLHHLMAHELFHVLGYDHGAAVSRGEAAVARSLADLQFIRHDYRDSEDPFAPFFELAGK